MSEPKRGSEQDYINRLKRRLVHLEERIGRFEAAQTSYHESNRENAVSWDKSEASALRWAIEGIELTMAQTQHWINHDRADGTDEFINIIEYFNIDTSEGN